MRRHGRSGGRAARAAAAVAAIAGLLVVGSVGVAGPASAASPDGLAISVPTSASAGSRPVGSSTTLQLGTVTVTSGRMDRGVGWSTTVSTTGLQHTVATSRVIAPSSMDYYSGPALSLQARDLLGVLLSSLTGIFECTPTLTARTLSSSPQTVMACANKSNLLSSLLQVDLSSTTVSWNPTVVIRSSSGDLSGTYTGTIVHSVS